MNGLNIKANLVADWIGEMFRIASDLDMCVWIAIFIDAVFFRYDLYLDALIVCRRISPGVSDNFGSIWPELKLHVYGHGTFCSLSSASV